MYKNLYKKASEMADLIQENVAKPESRTTSKFIDQASKGLVRRRQEAMQQVSEDADEGIANLISGYISNIRQNNPADAIEEYLRQRQQFSAEEEPTRDSGTFDFGDVTDFADRLGMRESSNRYDIQIQATSGGKEQNVTGRYQFTDDRLEEYMNDTGASFSTDEFRQDPRLQDDVFAWHMADIDRAIERGGFVEQGYDLNGLRAVAHLGGIGGMRQFVRSGGNYNPGDKFGTRLSTYYNDFSGQ
jgi:hypothetical protein